MATFSENSARAIGSLGILILGLAIAFMKINNELEEADRKIAKLEMDVSDAANHAYKDCRTWMITERSLQRVNGCYETIEILCKRTKKPKFCVDRLNPACLQMSDE